LQVEISRLSPFDLVVCGRQAIDGDTAQAVAKIADAVVVGSVLVNKIAASPDNAEQFKFLMPIKKPSTTLTALAKKAHLPMITLMSY